MADPRYGAGGEGFAETLTRMQQQAAASDELRRKEEQRASVEERSTGALRENLGAREATAGATDRLASSLTGVIDLLNAETAALAANTAAWQRKLAAEAGGGVAGVPRAAPSASAAAAAAPLYPHESPQLAQIRYEQALRGQAAAEISQRQARSAVTAAQRTGATPEGLAPLIAQRETANQAVADARAQSRAMQQNVRATEQAARAQDAARASQEAENARLAAAERELAASAQASARRFQAASLLGGGPGLPGGGGGVGGLPPGAGPLAALGAGRSPLLLGRGVPGRVGLGGVAADVAAGDLTHPYAGLPPATAELAGRNAADLERIAGAQGEVNRMMQQSVAQYGASSQALQRHGALTAEFIQAFARGEVTLQEFQSQMLTTMGKFGGWAIAGAAVFGVVDALRKLADGAKEAQSGYVQLTRFIPNVNQGQAEHTFTDISSQLNVPIKDVVDTMTIVARTFKTLPEAAEATRAVLLASKLDQISPEQAAPQLVGISQAFGLDAHGVMGVIDSLNALQREYGARVSQTLPGLAKAAPAALAAGVDEHTLEALIGVGVRGGLSGSQVATAVARSATTFVQKPQDQALLESYGFNPNQPYGNLIKQISATIAQRDKEGKPISGEELRSLAIGLAGPQLGARTFATILARGGLINQFAATAESPGETAAQERQKQLKSVGEQLSSIGIGIENFGASLASSGILIPLQSLLTVIHDLGSAADALLSPFASFGTSLAQLPGPLREILGALALGAAGQAVYRTTFGRTATGALSQIPGLSFLDTPQAQSLRELQHTQVVGFDFAQRRVEQSSYAATVAAHDRDAAARAATSFALSPAEAGRLSPDQRGKYEAQLSELIAAQSNAEKKAIAAQEQYLTDLQTVREYEARIKIYKSTELSNAQKLAFAQSTGGAATPFGAPTTAPIRTGVRATDEELARNAALSTDAIYGDYFQQARTGRYRTTPELSSGGTTTPGGLYLPPGAERQGAKPLTGALDSVPDEAIADQALRSVEAEQPGFIAGKLQNAAGRARSSGSLVGALAATGLGFAGASPPVHAADAGLRGLSGLGSGLVAGIPGALGAAFQGVLAGQIVNAVAPGGVGDFLGSAITGGSLGLGGASLANTLLEKYGKDYRVSGVGAFGVGVGLQQAQQGGVQGALGVGLAAGSAAALIPGVGPAVAIPVGLVAAGASLLKGGDGVADFNKQIEAQAGAGAPQLKDIFGLDKFKKQLQQYVSEQKQLGSVGNLDLSDDTIASFGETFKQQLSDAFTKTGKDAQTAVTNLNHDISVMATKLQLFGGQGQTGQQATSLLREAVSQAVQAAGADPSHIDEYLQVAQKAQQALDADAQQQFQIANARARSGQDRSAALQQLIASQQATIQAEYSDPATQLQQKLTQLDAQYNELLGKRATGGSAFAASGGSKRLNSLGDQITQAQGSINALQQGGAQQSALNLVQQAQAQSQVYSSIQGDIQSATGLAQAQAGSDTLGSLKAQLQGQRQELQNAATNLTLNPEQQTNELNGINAKIIQTNDAIVKEYEARIEALQKLQEAEVPLNEPLAAVNKVYADAQSTLARMLADNAKSQKAGQGPIYSPEEIDQQRIAVIQAARQRAQTGLTNLQAQNTLAASSIPSTQPVQQAQAAYRSAESVAAYMEANAKSFNYADIVKAMADVNTAWQAVQDALYQNTIQMAEANAEIAKAQHPGDAVAQAGTDVGLASQELSIARNPLERAQGYAKLLGAQNAQYQAITARADAGYQIQETLAYGDARQQAAINAAKARYDLSRARGPEEQNAALQELAQAQEQAHQATIAHVESQAQLTETQLTGDPIRQAQVAERAAREELATAHGIDERVAAEQKLAAAEQQLYQAELQRTQSAVALRQAQASGDAVAQAEVAVRGAATELSQAHGRQPRQQAETQLTQANYQLHQARQQRIGALGSLAEASEQGDPVAEARTAVQVAQRLLANAHGVDEVIAGQTQLRDAQYKYHQALQQQIAVLGSLAEAQAQGDPLAAASIALQVAQQMLANARGFQEEIQAETALAQAQLQYHQALQDRITALGALAASTTRDPLEELRDEIAAAQQVLANAVTDQEKISAQTNLNNLQNQYQAAVISQTEATINFQLQMKQITAQQAIQQLKSLEDTGNLTLQERQQVEEQIRQLQLGGGTSEFNLAPGKIKLPTIYDVVRAMQGTAPIGVASPSVVANSQTQINVYVRNAGDVPAVADALDRATGSQLAAQLRAAGIS